MVMRSSSLPKQMIDTVPVEALIPTAMVIHVEREAIGVGSTPNQPAA